MTEEENQLLMEHARAIAKILYKNAPVEELTSLGSLQAGFIAFSCSLLTKMQLP
ncbi:hypothetical protein PI95_033725 [Hassallia byssoidea VB512170]|jgi:hypothetical protein|uniref:Uncharacterized protein n=1 Tax=Hassallia byssoidea VB512170 TaxID=1304833 RepID=A0A846HPD8_9CYAN|nr:hypothetical protein [Hassalia byssoidea]MBW4571859.1 hypothetical protein [Tolypothrix carrinoi HA7290-LM1]NEU77311.1 hypothetical protein [Hassalia byssoidea VB512170]